VDQILPCPPLGHLCGSERPQHPTNPSMESELSRLSNRPGQCAVVFLPHSTTDFLGASSAPQWATYLCRLRNLDSLRTRLLKTPAMPHYFPHANEIGAFGPAFLRLMFAYVM